MLHLYHDETPTDVEPVCPKHGCTLYPGTADSMPGMRRGSRRGVSH